jgi:single-strand DNA-binding protein
MKEDAEFHRIVAWNKLAELCSQLLTKGRKIYVEGRLSTHSWTAQDGTQRTSTEVVIEDMIILDSKRTAPAADAMNAEGAKPSGNYPAETASSQGGAADAIPEEKPGETVEPVKQRKSSRKSAVKTEASVPNEESQKTAPEAGTDDITPDDIPF